MCRLSLCAHQAKCTLPCRFTYRSSSNVEGDAERHGAGDPAGPLLRQQVTDKADQHAWQHAAPTAAAAAAVGVRFHTVLPAEACNV